MRTALARQGKGRSVLQRDYFTRALDTKALAIGKPFLAPSTKRPVLTWAVPIRDAQGKVVAVLAASAVIGRSDLFSQISSRKSREAGDIHVISPSDKLVVVSTDSTLILTALDDTALQGIATRFKDRWEGSDIVVDSHGVETLVSGTRVSGTDWIVVNALPAATAFLPIADNITHTYRDAGIVALLVAMLGWFFLRIQLNPLTRVARELREISTDRAQLHALPEIGSDEIRQVIGSFNRLQTQITNQQRRLRESEERWKFALEGAGEGVWDRDLITGKVDYSARYKELYGFAEHELENHKEEWYERVHPDDIALVKASRDAYANGTIPIYANERRMRCKDGSWKWVLVRGMIIPAEDGTPLRMIGTHTDISERKIAEEALREKELELTEAQRIANIGSWYWEAETDATRVSDQLLEIFGQPCPLFQEQKGTMYPAESWEQLNAAVQETVRTGVGYQLDLEALRGDGTRIWVTTRAEAVRDPSGKVVALRGTVQDITERKKLERELERLAQTDVLTGLANRRSFMLLAEQEVARASRYGGALQVLMMDVDHFKGVNDTFGHKTGDVVLQKIAHLCRESVRVIDVVGRIGGEEFAFVLPETDHARGMDVAERMRLLIEQTDIQSEQGQTLRVTVSIGITSLAGEVVDIQALLSQADKALYAAKHGGRNRVVAGIAGAATPT